MIEETVNKLIQLKLPHMAEVLRAQLEKGAGSALTLEECVGLMVDREWTERENRRTARRINMDFALRSASRRPPPRINQPFLFAM